VSTTAGALYTAAWALLCLVAVVVAWRSPRKEGPFSMGYRRLLTTPWRLATGAVATVFLVGAAPYANVSARSFRPCMAPRSKPAARRRCS